MFLIIFSSLIADLEFSRTTYDYSNGLLNPVVQSHIENVHVEFVNLEDHFEYLIERENGARTKLICLHEHYEAFVTKGDIHESCEGYRLIDNEEIVFDPVADYENVSFPFSQLKDVAMSSIDIELLNSSITKDGEHLFSNRINLSEESEDGFWKWNIRGEVITAKQGFPIIASRVFTKMNPALKSS